MTENGRIQTDGLRASASLYGPQRARRPSDVRGDVIVCPFCPGNEHLTGALLTADPGPQWQSRVIANLYPAVIEPDGRHEVIVELRDHAAVWDALDAAAVERVLRVYRDREATGYADGYRFVAIFKNAGGPAGASLLHPHAQVIALRAIPASIAGRVERSTEVCPSCAACAYDPGVVSAAGTVVAYVPAASRTAFEIRVAPRAHASRFSACSDATLTDLAVAVADALGRLARVFGEGFPFNMIVQSAPRDPRAQSLMHWEIELVPRVENFGGFEVGTGSFLVSRTPEDAAGILRAHAGVAHA